MKRTARTIHKNFSRGSLKKEPQNWGRVFVAIAAIILILIGLKTVLAWTTMPPFIQWLLAVVITTAGILYVYDEGHR